MRGAALGLAAGVLALDQAVKAWMHAALTQPPRAIEVTPFFNLVLVWNPGISFGMLPGGSALKAWLLAAFGAGVALAMGVWLWRGRHGVPGAAGLGLLIGGAAGNAVDRARFGAVMDYADLHVAGWHWPAFNVADTGITLGVGLLLLDAVRRERTETGSRR